MKEKNIIIKGFLLATTIALIASCTTVAAPKSVGERTAALGDSAWDSSQWISAVDAPVATGKKLTRAADGANWFLSTVKNEQTVTSAKWMTTALGVYEIYVNGKLVGEEVLKPGFTHRAKTKHSFTYDVTEDSTWG